MTPKFVPAGEMRTVLRWYRLVGTGQVDSNNHPIETWQVAGTIQGRFKGMGGRTAEDARQLIHQAIFEFVCQFVPNLNLRDELRELGTNGRRFAIGHINNVFGYDRQQIVTLTEVQTPQ